ncbi:hypothetical protein GCM10011380_31660 [Sphingomonas metalli]|uniref:Uncharacterized protein n=1 Tax=Sphingomonas metalli TaxID=1779358 RepID=A0A916TCK0_9SPHN|nr:hypothetical protein [Sphingomonas metalli]GGB39812.1 hypothetical protein GCM10011380_31660 [Sphingomonas metalli]
MTLIIAVEAVDCMVLAADSLTTVRDRVVSCDTVKIHQVSATDVAAGAGASRIQGRYWSEILPGFLERWAGPGPAQIAPHFKRFLDAEIQQVDRRNIGACAGGNTFLIAGLDPSSGRPDIWSVERHGDVRSFLPARPASPQNPTARIWWIGDTQGLQAHVASTASRYSEGMTEDEAVAFAVQAIIDGMASARAAGIRSIGGDYAYWAVATGDGVKLNRKRSGIPCP